MGKRGPKIEGGGGPGWQKHGPKMKSQSHWGDFGNVVLLQPREK
jgi:hypothetical protein